MQYPILLAVLMPETAEWLLVVWLLCLGGAVGSFLNVVIYRLPNGISVVKPGSHCPLCKHPIRWHDNVPVLGWIFLGGRCRDCRTRIPLRYPAVEATSAVLFAALALVECVWGGVNLPVRPVEAVAGLDGSVPDLGQLYGVYVYHLILLCTLLAGALIEYDGHRLPWGLVVPVLVVGLLAPLAWPQLRPVPAVSDLDGPIAGLVDGTTGLAAGALLGGLWLRGGGREKGRLLGPLSVGLVLGWQAAVVLSVSVAAIHLVLTSVGPSRAALRRIPPSAWLGVATTAWIVFWGPLVDRWPILAFGI